MTLSNLQSFVYTSKYSRWDANLQRRETFEESTNRVFDMHERRFAGKGVDAEIAFAKKAMLDRLVLGSQRALQFGGAAVEQKHARSYNCTTSYADRPRFFQECFWLLLCGCGTGFSVQRHHVAKLPDLVAPDTSFATTSFKAPDTIEGWADCLGILLASYGIAAPEFKPWIGRNVVFDLSLIRPEGSTIASGSGKAPGPEPLRAALEKIRGLLNRCVAAGQTRLRSIDVYDVIMHASDAVLAGGVRRSASICLFSADDQEMITAKTGNWFYTDPQRGRSNNSALLLRDKTSFEEFSKLMESVKEFGEPGFVWADDTEITYNPCVEIGLYPTINGKEFQEVMGCFIGEDTKEGWVRELGENDQLSGWAFCNLCEINMKACKTPEIFERACRAAAIIGSMQASYTDFHYLGPVSSAIAKREALLGVSMTGMMDTPDVAFDLDLQRAMAKVVLDVNAEFAPRIGVRPTARATCVKPAGTTSCILGTSSGIHAHHARKYFRRVQANEMEAPYQHLKMFNPRACERSVWSATGRDAVITFCVDVPKHARTRNQVSALKLLEHVKDTQLNWVDSGRVLERCAKPFLRHNVSNTITVRPEEWPEVTRYIYDHRAAFAGISILPYGGDLDYPQAPFCAVWTFEEIAKEYGVGSLFASGLIVDGLKAFNDDLWKACSAIQGFGGDVSDDAAKVDWVRRAKQFSTRYFEGDVKRCIECLKRVSLAKLWEDLTREAVDVDYTTMVEKTDETTMTGSAACAGGKCDII